MTGMTTKSQPMTTLNTSKTWKMPHIRTGKQTIIAAESADGRWRYGREDDEYTTWTVCDTRTGEIVCAWLGTLKAARVWTYEREQQEREQANA
jgi:hypothetical protein